jgi:ABC-2 type transport system ATP-binding protein
MGVMLQRGGVYPMLGPTRVLDLFSAYYADPVPTDELLELVGLRAVASTSWRHLSGGEQQRLSLALALIGRPQIAFLDEPTSGVDPEGRIAIRAVVAELKEKGVSVVLTTHELAEAERMADRILIMAKGRIVLEGTPGELAASGNEPAVAVVTFGAPSGLDAAALASSIGPRARVTENPQGRYRVETSDQPGPALAATVTAFLAERGVAMTDLVVGRTLEDVYFSAVGPQAATSDTAPDTPGATTTSGAGRRRRPRR